MLETCSIEGCEKPVNKDGLCLLHKLRTVAVGTVPGGHKAERTHIDWGRKMEKNLDRYYRRKKAGDNPSGIGDEAYKRDRNIERAAERGLIDLE